MTFTPRCFTSLAWITRGWPIVSADGICASQTFTGTCFTT